MPNRPYLAAKLREARKAASIDADEAGRMVGRSGKTVFAWEAGISEPSPEMLIAVCRAYGVPISFFFPPDVVCAGLPSDERELIGIYRSVTPAGQRAIMSSARGAMAEYGKSDDAGRGEEAV